jgi:diaminopimelate epimerase
VELRGGELRVAWPGAGAASLEGPTTRVFSGVLEFEAESG